MDHLIRSAEMDIQAPPDIELAAKDASTAGQKKSTAVVTKTRGSVENGCVVAQNNISWFLHALYTNVCVSCSCIL